MKYLAIDTSSDVLSIALAEGQDENITIVDSINSAQDRQHGVTLVPQIKDKLTLNNWKPTDIDHVIVGAGPGSYTGLRIGITVAKMWGISNHCPVSTVSSLALIASQCLDSEAFIIPVIDARRLSAYTNIYQWRKEGLVSLYPDQHIDWQNWLDYIKPLINDNSQKTWIFVGKEIGPFVDVFKEKYSEIMVEVIDNDYIYPDISRCFLTKLMKEVEDIHTLAPNYAHATLAEQEWALKNERTIANEEENEGFIEHFS